MMVVLVVVICVLCSIEHNHLQPEHGARYGQCRSCAANPCTGFWSVGLPVATRRLTSLILARANRLATVASNDADAGPGIGNDYRNRMQ
uniref:Putative secreted protein n=1 Tax=Anopheles darlingi TaxID=43151 RepID=A0A2M4D8W7_ANODA